MSAASFLAPAGKPVIVIMICRHYCVASWKELFIIQAELSPPLGSGVRGLVVMTAPPTSGPMGWIVCWSCGRLRGLVAGRLESVVRD